MGFLRHLFAAFFGEGVELGFPAGLRFFPLGLEPTAILQAVKGGIERALMNLKKIFRDLLQSLGDGVTVAGAEGDDLENQHVEGSAEEFDLRIAHGDT